MHTADTLKNNLKRQQKTNTSWLVTTIKSILKKPLQKLENPIFSFKRTNKTAVSNSKILAAFNGDLSTSIDAQKTSPLKYRSEFCNTADN